MNISDDNNNSSIICIALYGPNSQVQNLRWPRSVFQIVWSDVHESTEKTLTGKKGSFYLAWT